MQKRAAVLAAFAIAVPAGRLALQSTDANGGADAVQRWSRLFLVPGMGHCGRGSLTTDSFDLLTALVNWVERDVPPDAIAAARRGEPRLTRPLCAYPKYAHYSGKGDQNDASSFVCRAP